MLKWPLLVVALYLLFESVLAAPYQPSSADNRTPIPGSYIGKRDVRPRFGFNEDYDVVTNTEEIEDSADVEDEISTDQNTPSGSESSSATNTTAQPDGTDTTSGDDRLVRGYKNAVYFTNWGIYGANFQPQQLPASKITHVIYAFADIASDGEVKSSDTYADIEKHYPTDSWSDVGKNAYGCVKQLYILKKQNRQMKILLSIGGWTYSPKFAPIAATEAGRQKFASSAVKIVADYGFDGLDIDWEYTTNEAETRNMILLLKACRKALDDYADQHAPGYHFLITIASPAGPQNYQKMDMKGIDPWVDSWHLMAYDYAGSWDSTSGYTANVFPSPSNTVATKFNTDQAVSDYIKQGISPQKIVLGLPLYGRSFEATNGVGDSYNGIGGGSIQSGVWLYRDLPKAGAQVRWDDVAKASFSYDPSSRELISYDTPQSALFKTQYLKQKGLGGTFFWEASGDKADDASLISVVAKGMGQLDQTQNLLRYPVSQYDNIRAGMPGS